MSRNKKAVEKIREITRQRDSYKDNYELLLPELENLYEALEIEESVEADEGKDDEGKDDEG